MSERVLMPHLGTNDGRGARSAAALLSRLRELLRTGGYDEGAHLRSKELADRLQISRFPIGVALKSLAAEGLVRHEPHRGYFLARAPTRSSLGPELHPLEVAYRAVAADHLAHRLPDRISATFVRERYQLGAAQTADLMGRIVAEGWAQRRTGSGWSMLAILRTPDVLLQTYRVRRAIEPAALLEPTFQISAFEIRRLEDREREILAGGAKHLSREQLYEAGVDFHETLTRSSGNPFFEESLRRVNVARRLIAYQSMVDRERYFSQARAHLSIIEHVAKGEMTLAASSMRQHLGDVADSLDRLHIPVSVAPISMVEQSENVP